MKCINNLYRAVSIVIVFSLCLCGCKQGTIPCQYNQVRRLQGDAVSDQFAEPFAADLCVAGQNVMEGTDVNMETGACGGLFDLNRHKVVYAKGIHERLHPASLTKMLTALVALKNGDTEDLITCSPNVEIKEPGATLCGLKAGDKLTLNQALHALLIHSANDAGVAIAEHIGGSIENFADMMNNEALQLGATNSHFSNPHGLTEAEHYSTVYDLYLIMNEVLNYDVFNEIIQMPEYSTVYHDANGDEKEMSFKSTNLFFNGTFSAPDKITVIGGKTGTTKAAGSCLALFTKDTSGNPYISVILNATEREYVYRQMIDMLEELDN